MKNENVTTLLSKAKELITDPSCWTTGTLAKNAEGNAVMTSDANATCFCAVGAVFHVARTTTGLLMFDDIACDYLDDAAKLFGKGHAPELNDDLGHGAVLEMFDKAIELAGKETDQ